MSAEEDFTKKVIIPMLHRIGYRRIRYVHGHDEHGRDLIFYDIDRLGQESLHAAQVKHGNIHGSEKHKIQSQIIPQLLEGLRQPYRDPETGKTHYVSRMYLIVSGEMLGTAKDQIHAQLEKQSNIVAIDRQTIDLLVSRDGIETMLGVTCSEDEYGIMTGTKGGQLPRLPRLMPGMKLVVPVDVEGFDFNGEGFKIADVTYDPLYRKQEVKLVVGNVPEELLPRLLDDIYDSLKNSSAHLWEEWENYA